MPVMYAHSEKLSRSTKPEMRKHGLAIFESRLTIPAEKKNFFATGFQIRRHHDTPYCRLPIFCSSAEKGACAGKMELAALAKKLNYDAVHDTVHEMAKDEARHGCGFAGLLKRYFG